MHLHLLGTQTVCQTIEGSVLTWALAGTRSFLFTIPVAIMPYVLLNGAIHFFLFGVGRDFRETSLKIHCDKL